MKISKVKHHFIQQKLRKLCSIDKEELDSFVFELLTFLLTGDSKEPEKSEEEESEEEEEPHFTIQRQ